MGQTFTNVFYIIQLGGNDEFAQGEKLKKTLCLTKIEMSGSYPASKNTVCKKEMAENSAAECSRREQ